MNTQFTGKSLLKVQQTDSTNKLAFRLLEENPVNGTVIFANEQSQGRGQQGTIWEAEKGKNLTTSIIYFPHFLNLENLFQINKMVSLAVVETLNYYLNYPVLQIKWPNDILLDEKKICGILIENQLDSTNLKVTVIGIGLNINQTSFSDIIKEKTHSMAKYSGNTFVIEEVLNTLLHYLEKQYIRLQAGNFASMDHQYLQLLFRYQETGLYSVGDHEFAGIIVGVRKDGKLAVQEGQKVSYYDFKEIQFL